MPRQEKLFLTNRVGWTALALFLSTAEQFTNYPDNFGALGPIMQEHVGDSNITTLSLWGSAAAYTITKIVTGKEGVAKFAAAIPLLIGVSVLLANETLGWFGGTPQLPDLGAPIVTLIGGICFIQLVNHLYKKYPVH